MNMTCIGTIRYRHLIASTILLTAVGCQQADNVQKPDSLPRVEVGNRSAARECAGLLQFDTTVLNTNMAAQASVLNMVNQSNYAEMKKSAGASVPGYFDGSYEEFEMKRSHFYSLFQSSLSVVTSSQFYRHALSEVGAKAYAQCLSTTSGAVIDLAAEGDLKTGQTIGVTLFSGARGNSKITYEFGGATPLGGAATGELQTGQSRTFIFRRDPKTEFALVVNARNTSTEEQKGLFFQIPAYKEYVRTKHRNSDDRIAPVCGAGGHNDFYGNQDVRNVSSLAADGWSYNPNGYVLENRQIIGGPGIAGDPELLSVAWPVEKDASGNNFKITSNISRCRGAHQHTQGHTRFTYRLTREKDQIIEKDLAVRMKGFWDGIYATKNAGGTNDFSIVQ